MSEWTGSITLFEMGKAPVIGKTMAAPLTTGLAARGIAVSRVAGEYTGSRFSGR